MPQSEHAAKIWWSQVATRCRVSVFFIISTETLCCVLHPLTSSYLLIFILNKTIWYTSTFFKTVFLCDKLRYDLFYVIRQEKNIIFHTRFLIEGGGALFAAAKVCDPCMGAMNHLFVCTLVLCADKI